MANLIGKLNFVAKKILNNLEITLVVLMVFFSPFIVNYNDLPKGYELPKVTFFQVFTIILLASFLLKVIYNTAQSNIVKFDKSLIVVFTAIFLILIASIISPFQAKLSFDSLLNEMPWIGNSFRFQGAFTHILMVIFAYIVYKRITRKNIIFIFLALFLSSFIQSLTAFGQLSYFLKVDPTVIFEGYYINGTFGQANFYSGRIMLGILSGIFLISIGSNLLHKKSIYQYLYFLFFYIFVPIATLCLIAGLIISFSTWGIITSVLMVFVLIVFELSNLFRVRNSKHYFGYFMGTFLVLGSVIGGYLLFKQYADHVENFRLNIWQKIVEVSDKFNPIHILFGNGFDTLGEVFKYFGEFKNLYVDRAHNFFLDIYTQSGIVSLIGLLGLILFAVFKFVFKNSSRTLTYLFVGLIMWLFRSFIHESGIVNLYDFLLLLGATLGLQKDIKFPLPSFIISNISKFNKRNTSLEVAKSV